mgnify:CR=1 FL=1
MEELLNTLRKEYGGEAADRIHKCWRMFDWLWESRCGDKSGINLIYYQETYCTTGAIDYDNICVDLHPVQDEDDIGAGKGKRITLFF